MKTKLTCSCSFFQFRTYWSIFYLCVWLRARALHRKCFYRLGLPWPFHNFFLLLNWVNFSISSSSFWTVFKNRELKHRRFWASDGNRKVNVLVFGALSSPPKSWKTLVLAFATLWTKSRWYAPKQRTFEFRLPSVAQKCLCLSSLISKQHGRGWRNKRNSEYYKQRIVRYNVGSHANSENWARRLSRTGYTKPANMFDSSDDKNPRDVNFEPVIFSLDKKERWNIPTNNQLIAIYIVRLSHRDNITHDITHAAHARSSHMTMERGKQPFVDVSVTWF